MRRIFGHKRDEVTGGWRNYIMRSCMVCTLLLLILLGCSNQGAYTATQTSSKVFEWKYYMRWAGHVV
jgi:hypothetical protein